MLARPIALPALAVALTVSAEAATVPVATHSYADSLHMAWTMAVFVALRPGTPVSENECAAGSTTCHASFGPILLSAEEAEGDVHIAFAFPDHWQGWSPCGQFLQWASGNPDYHFVHPIFDAAADDPRVINGIVLTTATDGPVRRCDFAFASED